MMKARTGFFLALLLVAVVFCAIGALLVGRGFRASSQPSRLEAMVARSVRNLAIPRSQAVAKNPVEPTPENLQGARDLYLARCASCHGIDGSGSTTVGTRLYPRAPDLRAASTQQLSDGQLHYIIENGVQLTGMPAWNYSLGSSERGPWQLVMLVRRLGNPDSPGKARQTASAIVSAHYVGSAACAKCHAELYDRWKKTPMANVVRDPREHPEAILPDLASNPIVSFTKEQVAFVYGSLWKQRYFTKIGDDYYPLGAQWEVKNKKWSKYHVADNTDWWVAYYPAENTGRPTGPLCDGCHSVDYNIRTHQVTEWNVGCERCHGPGGEHLAHPTRTNILNPAAMNYVAASDTCIQCHSQGRRVNGPIEGKYYDWPVGYSVGGNLRDYWKLEEPNLGQQDFYYFAEGTAHKNRMQGNDFVQSVMYTRGITCFDCHDVHGTGNYAQLRKPAQQLCLDCHSPGSPNGPRTPTIEAHTHHKETSAGSECIACHMPQIETEGPPNTFVRSHTFKFIAPFATAKYKIPNSCNSCHTDKTPEWAAEAMKHWAERSPWRIL
jgi:predicted CXXCH cytochrome family protein